MTEPPVASDNPETQDADKRGNWEFERKIQVGHLLTTASVLISVTAAISSWSRSQSLERHAQANEVRRAAAVTFAKIERRKELSLWVFHDIQSALVATSELLEENYDVGNARDHLWKALNESRMGIRQRILAENLEAAYVDLFTYRPEVRDQFRKAMERLTEHEDRMIADLLAFTEAVVLEFNNEEPFLYQSADLGNRLRRVVSKVQAAHSRDVTAALMDIESFLRKIIESTDKALVYTSPKSANRAPGSV